MANSCFVMGGLPPDSHLSSPGEGAFESAFCRVQLCVKVRRPSRLRSPPHSRRADPSLDYIRSFQRNGLHMTYELEKEISRLRAVLGDRGSDLDLLREMLLKASRSVRRWLVEASAENARLRYENEQLRKRLVED